MKIYVASSWRNEFYTEVVKLLRDCGHEVYDFRTDNEGFSWRVVDSNWENWTPQQFTLGLDHSAATRGFQNDMKALEECDLCVLVLPCGRSAHLELGFAVGAGKYSIVHFPDECPQQEPELMYAMVNAITIGRDDLLDSLETIERYADMKNPQWKAAAAVQ